MRRYRTVPAVSAPCGITGVLARKLAFHVRRVKASVYHISVLANGQRRKSRENGGRVPRICSGDINQIVSPDFQKYRSEFTKMPFPAKFLIFTARAMLARSWGS